MAEWDKWQLVAWAVVAALLVLVAIRVLGSDGPGRSGAAPSVQVDGRAAGKSGDRARGGELYVHVAGAVRRPGLLRVPLGSRVAAAIERAGGPGRRADLTAINLAATLEDGQQVVVPRLGSAGSAIAPGSGAPGSPVAGPASGATAPTAGAAGSISLATATIEQLDSLDGIGPTLARRIVEHRQRTGGFRSLAELREVDGIGEKRFEALKAALRP